MRMYSKIVLALFLSIYILFSTESSAVSTGISTPKANSPEENGLPQQSPTPFNAVCPLGIWNFEINSITGGGNLDTYTPSSTDNSRPSCLPVELENARKICQPLLGSRSYMLFDNCVAAYFGFVTYSQSLTPLSNRERKYGSLKAIGSCRGRYCGNTATATLFLDTNCRQVAEPENISATCDAGSYSFLFSPISLILDEQTYQQNEWKITKFPINPNRKDDFYLWKASKSLPLLVWDPEHRGKIVSGEQLFGNWTFGGKKLSSLNSIAPFRTSWRDGYEALGSLDTNQDSKINGEELKPLGLWFDRNQDGISQDGEVIPAQQFGIINLYYNADNTESGTKSIIATKGYERIFNNQLETGRSVDWYSDSAANSDELIFRQMAVNSLCKKTN